MLRYRRSCVCRVVDACLGVDLATDSVEYKGVPEPSGVLVDCDGRQASENVPIDAATEFGWQFGKR